jgi:hypothetical protein
METLKGNLSLPPNLFDNFDLCLPAT